MDDALKPVIDLIPAKWRTTLTILIVLSPYISRGFYAIKSGGGLKGILCAIWIGTNTPKQQQAAQPGEQPK